MPSCRLSRRHFLALPLTVLLGPIAGALAQAGSRRSSYEVDVGILYGALRFRLAGGIHEQVDRASGRYEVRQEGEGTGFATRGESRGMLREGRWVPLHTSSWLRIAGREGVSEIAYDYERRVAQYRSRSETFFLGRIRVVDDVVPMAAGVHVDDVVSAILNHADGLWRADPRGTLETHVVRRVRDPHEGVEERSGTHRAEIATVTLPLEIDPVSGKRTMLLDLTQFSSWALRDTPARIVVRADGRPEAITSRLMFGTSLTVSFGDG
jgi:hypothetical protein